MNNIQNEDVQEEPLRFPMIFFSCVCVNFRMNKNSCTFVAYKKDYFGAYQSTGVFNEGMLLRPPASYPAAGCFQAFVQQTGCT